VITASADAQGRHAITACSAAKPGTCRSAGYAAPGAWQARTSNCPHRLPRPSVPFELRQFNAVGSWLRGCGKRSVGAPSEELLKVARDYRVTRSPSLTARQLTHRCYSPVKSVDAVPAVKMCVYLTENRSFDSEPEKR